MRVLVFILLVFVVASCTITPTLKKIGAKGLLTTTGPVARFDPTHPAVEIWTPSSKKLPPIMVYAHGGAGYRNSDRARVSMFRRNGFATISFDAYEMNGFDWKWVRYEFANLGKQNMIWGVFKGAVDYAINKKGWDNRNIFLYGISNGGRVVLHGASKLTTDKIKGVISEAPAAAGRKLGDLKVPTIIAQGKMDNWGGRFGTDYIWKRTFPFSPISVEKWVQSLQENERPIRFIFYKNAGHSFHSGSLERVSQVRVGGASFTAYLGAAEGVVAQYERDIFAFVKENMVR